MSVDIVAIEMHSKGFTNFKSFYYDIVYIVKIIYIYIYICN